MKKIIVTTPVVIGTGLSGTDLLQPVQATQVAKSLVIEDKKVFDQFARNKTNSNIGDHDFGLMLIAVGALLAFCSIVGFVSQAFPFGKKSHPQQQPTQPNKPRATEDSTPCGDKRMTPLGYVEQAYTAFRQGDTQRAIAQLNDAIRLHPDDAYVYTERANFRHRNLGDREGALKDYTQAIHLHPENPLLYLWRCQLYNEIGESLKAMADYNTAIRLAPEGTMYHFFQTNLKSARR